MTTEFEVRTMSVVVIPIGEEIYSERATIVSIDDEGGGEFVCVKQPGMSNLTELRFDSEDWPRVRRAIDDMINLCRNKGGSQ